MASYEESPGESVESQSHSEFIFGDFEAFFELEDREFLPIL